MRTKLLVFVIFTTAILQSCSKISSEFTDTPVIEAYLRPGENMNVIVSRQIPFASAVGYSSDDIDNLSITVSNRGRNYLLIPQGDGRYRADNLIVEAGEKYEISFLFNSRNVSAYTTIPSRPLDFTESASSISVLRMDSTTVMPQPGSGTSMFEPLTLKWTNDDGSYYIVVIENMEATPDPVRDFGDDGPPAGIFKKQPVTSSGLELRPQEFQYFGRHRLILYHVLPDYASLYKEITTSSQNLTNPSTSIVNGYGIFTGLNADTLYLDVKEAK